MGDRRITYGINHGSMSTEVGWTPFTRTVWEATDKGTARVVESVYITEQEYLVARLAYLTGKSKDYAVSPLAPHP